MNLSKFLKTIDKICKEKTKEELECFIHEWARNLPAAARNEYVNVLESSGVIRQPLSEEVHMSLLKRFDVVKQGLEKIASEELTLECEITEIYNGDWYHDEEEYTYYDNSGIGAIIEAAGELLYECAENGEFDIGCELANRLISLEAFVNSDWYDMEPLHLSELQENGVARIEYKRVILSQLYMTYRMLPLQKRPKALYEIMDNNAGCRITLEEVMQIGEELPEFDSFLELWIDYLGKMLSNVSQSLIEEAVSLMNDETSLLKYAEKYADTHPGLYEKYLKGQLPVALESKEKSKELYQTGHKALNAIKRKYVVRSRIALIMLQLAERLEDIEISDYCMFEAFSSNSTVSNYLRLRVNCHDYCKYKEKTDVLCKEFLEASQAELSGIYTVRLSEVRMAKELAENKIDNVTANMLTFLQGDFKVVLEQGMKIKQALGWSGTFMKCGLAAFLLLLYDGEKLSVGTKRMCQIIVNHTGNVSFATNGLSENEDEITEFWKIFLQWKRQMTMLGEQQSYYVRHMEELINKRVQGIMEANRRNYYDECASYVAALGEVKESLGLVSSKQVMLEKYRSQYPRRRAFHDELKKCGLIR